MPSVTYQPSEADLIAVYRLHANHAFRKASFWVRFAIVTLIVACVSAWIWSDDFGVDLGALIGPAYWFLFFGMLILIGRLGLPRRVRRVFAQQKSFHGETTVEWSDEAITFTTPRGTTTYPWSDFVRILENKHSIALMQSDVTANFIPKRVLSPEQAASITAHAFPIR